MTDAPFSRPRLVGPLFLLLALGALGYSIVSSWHHWDVDVDLGAQGGNATFSSTLDWELRALRIEGPAARNFTESGAGDSAALDYDYKDDEIDLSFVKPVFDIALFLTAAAAVLALIGLVMYLLPQFGANLPPVARRLSIAFVLLALLLAIAAPLYVMAAYPPAYDEATTDEEADEPGDSPAESFWGEFSTTEDGATAAAGWGAGYGWFASVAGAVLTTAGLAFGWTNKPLFRRAAAEPETAAALAAEPVAMAPVVLSRDIPLRCPACQNLFTAAAGLTVPEVACPACGRHSGS